MKIAFCLFHYYPYGGLERDFMRIATEAKQRGHTIQVFTTHWEGDNPHDFPITYIPVKGFSNHKRCASFATQLKQYLAQQTYDLVVGFNRMPHLDVYYAADVCFQKAAQQKHAAWYRLTPRYRTLLKLEQAVFAPTAHTKILSLVPSVQQDYCHYYDTPIDRFYAVPPGIDKNRLLMNNTTQIRTTLRQVLHLTDNDYFLLMVGSDFMRKGVDRALHALAALPDRLKPCTHLFVVGKGKAHALLKLAVDLNVADRVHFLGARDDVGQLMAAADMLLHPAYQETAGMVLLEALVAGLPIIVTANCGYAFHVTQADAGIVVSVPFQQQTLNAALTYMLTSTKRKAWQANAKNYAVSADLYRLPQHAVDLFEQFVREKMPHD